MKRFLKWVVIGVVVLLGITYATYAYSYQGNYNLDVSVKLNVSTDRTIALTEFTSVSSSTSMLQFWEQLKGGGGNANTRYMVHWELTQSTGVVTLVTRTYIDPGSSGVLKQTFSNIPAGSDTLKITVFDEYGASINERTFPVVVG